jgi:hypothetical protein
VILPYETVDCICTYDWFHFFVRNESSIVHADSSSVQEGKQAQERGESCQLTVKMFAGFHPLGHDDTKGIRCLGTWASLLRNIRREFPSTPSILMTTQFLSVMSEWSTNRRGANQGNDLHQHNKKLIIANKILFYTLTCEKLPIENVVFLQPSQSKITR